MTKRTRRGLAVLSLLVGLAGLTTLGLLGTATLLAGY